MMSNKKIAQCKRCFLLLFGWFALAGPASAVPFNVFDARTMAMAGVGVATGTNNAVFNNPALLTTADEIHEWFLLLPTVAQEKYDPDSLDDGLTVFQKDADVLFANNNVANQNAAQASLDKLDGNEYHYASNIAVMLAIPSRILSGAVFLNSYENYSANPVIGGDDVTTPSIVSTLAHRGIRVVENGVSAAKILESKNSWLNGMAIGFSAKYLLIETYNYETGIRTAEVEIDGSQGNNGSQFSLDVGVLKEFGVWKIALVGKNLLPGEYDFISSNDKLKIEPQLRAGFAYKSRRSVLEFDIDLTENKAVGFESATQMAALGWEWQAARNFSIRAGANKNLAGTEAAYASAGIGIFVGGFQVDIAGYSGDEGDGVSGQLGFRF